MADFDDVLINILDCWLLPRWDSVFYAKQLSPKSNSKYWFTFIVSYPENAQEKDIFGE